MHYLVAGSAEERCLVLAVNWPTLVAGGLTGAAAAAAASAGAVVGMPAAYSLMAAEKQKKEIKTHFHFQSAGPLFSPLRSCISSPISALAIASTAHSSDLLSSVATQHITKTESLWSIRAAETKGREGGGREDSELAWQSTENADTLSLFLSLKWAFPLNLLFELL